MLHCYWPVLLLVLTHIGSGPGHYLVTGGDADRINGMGEEWGGEQVGRDKVENLEIV